MLWHLKVASYPDPANAREYLDKKYLAKVTVDYTTCQYLLRMCGRQLDVRSTNYRQSVDPAKRLAITLNWLAHVDKYIIIMHWCIYMPCHCS